MHKNSNLSVAFCVSYAYDVLGRPVTRGADRFGYNGRSEVVSALTDGIAANYAYDAIGNTVAESGAMASAFPFRFSTKYYDAESGLYYYGYRFYSPKLGRWLTRDPLKTESEDTMRWSKCCREVSLDLSLATWDATTYPNGFLRRRFKAYRAAMFLEQKTGYEHGDYIYLRWHELGTWRRCCEMRGNSYTDTYWEKIQ